MPTKPPTHQPFGPPKQRERVYDQQRGNSADRGYDRQWRKIRLAKLLAEPLCRFCLALDHTTPAQEVDHIDGNSRNNAGANLRSLCKPCHSARTARDQSFGRG